MTETGSPWDAFSVEPTAPVFTFFTDDCLSTFRETFSDLSTTVARAPAEAFYELLYVYSRDSTNQLPLNILVMFLNEVFETDGAVAAFLSVAASFPSNPKIVTLLRMLKLDDDLLVAYLATPMLVQLDVVPVDFDRQLKKRLRDRNYTSKKFNLLHEESEGYARLLTEVHANFAADDCLARVESTHRAVCKLIGHFNLDSTRVLDLLLDVFAASLVKNWRFAVQFLRISQWWPRGNEADNSALDTLFCGGSDTAAKLIGLKLSKHDRSKELPESLKALVAVLVKEGFVSFGSIFYYFSPEGETMATLEDDYKQRMDAEILKASANELVFAAPLGDSDDEFQEKEKKEPKPVKKTATVLPPTIQLLRTFLGAGLFWPSVYILLKFPCLPFVDDAVADLLNRLVRAAIASLYAQIQPIQSAKLFEKLQVARKLATGKKDNRLLFKDHKCKHLYTLKPLAAPSAARSFTYFYDHWRDGVPAVRTLAEFVAVSRALLKFNKTRVARDPALFVEMCRIVVAEVRAAVAEPDAAFRVRRSEDMFQYFRTFLFPAMATLCENGQAVDEAYRVLAFFPLEDRYNLYSEMDKVLCKSNLEIKWAYGRAEKDTKDVMKRLLTSNIKAMMRRLSKISYANPIPVFRGVVSRLESFDNLSVLVVDAAKYFNTYGWDCLMMTLLVRLTSERSALQSDGLNDRHWVKSLSSFIGKLCKRYPQVDIKILMTYLLKSFRQHDISGLSILREVLAEMSGIKPISDLSLQQIELLGAGPSLIRGLHGVIKDTRYESARSSRRFVDALTAINGLAELFVLLCRLEEEVVFNSNESHLKILCNKKDELNSLLHIFTETNAFFTRSDAFLQQMPDVCELVVKYDVPVEWSFEIWRKFLGKLVAEDEAVGKGTAAETASVWNPVLLPIVELISQALPSHWQFLSQGLYVTFWQLSLYDIVFPEKLYSTETERLTGVINGLASDIRMSYRDKEISYDKISEKEDHKAALAKIVAAIPGDSAAHRIHHSAVMVRMNREKGHWFPSGEGELQMRDFFSHCLLPRARHSSLDAMYVARFVFMLHLLGAKHFSTLALFKVIFASQFLLRTLFTSSRNEAENLGIFFSQVLRQADEWRDEVVFAESARGEDLPGLVPLGGTELLTFDEFRAELFHWHNALLSDLSRSLNSVDYNCRRNAITFLSKLLVVYPSIDSHCEILAVIIHTIATTDPREDIKLAATGLLGQVRSRRKNCVAMPEFYAMSPEEAEQYTVLQTKKVEVETAKIKAQKAREASEKQVREYEAYDKLMKAREQQKLASQRASEEKKAEQEPEEKAEKIEELKPEEKAKQSEEKREKKSGEKSEEKSKRSEKREKRSEEKRSEEKREKRERREKKEKRSEEKKDSPVRPAGPRGATPVPRDDSKRALPSGPRKTEAPRHTLKTGAASLPPLPPPNTGTSVKDILIARIEQERAKSKGEDGKSRTAPNSASSTPPPLPPPAPRGAEFANPRDRFRAQMPPPNTNISRLSDSGRDKRDSGHDKRDSRSKRDRDGQRNRDASRYNLPSTPAKPVQRSVTAAASLPPPPPPPPPRRTSSSSSGSRDSPNSRPYREYGRSESGDSGNSGRNSERDARKDSWQEGSDRGYGGDRKRRRQ
ncbi:hypothetical protein BABINDRAFT_161688 [Babjeviella inositovora NRRL Y-12698]|uniref:THO complex subunit 2 n=1 Tax=Babjeviella inositovora NRRL Y-12698 TaxID=984486 RepID=A0A1E3QQS1_9ASCO|nr:uncharacterized protein BABINDRAFT_161688 [Babjeviella inositovora NRRL Y-12698]ODQ80046.1 hypothetical protein BABINDRAFT_161688 [Babjeviella inositovora NRRL Y-12698]